MRASYNWLCELSGVDAPAEEVARRLTDAGLEVEGMERRGEGLDHVVVAEVRGRRAHPEREKLSLVTVFDGAQEIEVVCGAPNVPEAGRRVIFARLGACLPGGFEIAERKIGGFVSRGMICSETELDIGAGSAGIFVFEAEGAPAPGTPVVEALGLRDVVFEIGLTPNRPDCLGHIGLARDLAVLFGRQLSVPVPDAPAAIAAAEPAVVAASHPSALELAGLWGHGVPETRAVSGEGKGPVDVVIEDAERCPRYGGAVVLGMAVGPSPFWLRYRLHCLGVRAISNLVDVTNVVMLEHGHPIHGFDLAKVRGRRIVVRTAAEGEAMATLDGTERTFTADDLLICDGEGPVAVAGVMGGLNSEIADDTTDVLIECAYFDPRSVRRTSRRLGLHTDASHRFERGVDPNGVPAVLARAATLMARLGGGAIVPTAVDVVARPIAPAQVTLRHHKIDQLLGVHVPTDVSLRILRGLGCEVEVAGEGEARVSVPTHRPDIGREVDLIEEVGRLHGYDHIPTVVPQVRPSSEGTPPRVGFVRHLREAVGAAGLHEAVTYSFVARESLERARASLQLVPLENPLSEERSVLRTSLLPGLAQAVGHAQRRQVDTVRLFEVGTTFHPDGDAPLPREELRLAFLLAGDRTGWIGGAEAFDFFDGKGVVEAVVRQLLGASVEAATDAELDADAPFLHPRRRGRLSAAGVALGVLGELHPDVSEALELTGRAIYADLSVDALFAAAAAVGVAQARPLPKFPAVTRDIAMVLSAEHAAADVARTLREASGGLAESVVIFDRYVGDNIPAGQVSLAFRVVYRDPAETLTDKRVDKAHQRLGKAVEDRFSATLR